MGSGVIRHCIWRAEEWMSSLPIAVSVYRSRTSRSRNCRIGRQRGGATTDVAESGTFDSFVEALKGVLSKHWQRKTFDSLVNNAGIGIHAAFADTTEKQFDGLVNIHFKGPFFLTQKLLPLIADNGRIVNLSSGLTRFSLPGYAAYAAMKGAMEVLTRYQAKELGSAGLRPYRCSRRYRDRFWRWHCTRQCTSQCFHRQPDRAQGELVCRMTSAAWSLHCYLMITAGLKRSNVSKLPVACSCN